MTHDCDNPQCNNPDCMGVAATQETISNYVEVGKWAIIGATKETATFCYTVGLHHHNLPELIMVGLNPEMTMYILNDCADMMIANNAFKHGTQIDELANMPTIIIDVLEEHKQEYTIQAFNHYHHWDFKLQQLVMPDEKQRFPWEPDFSEHMLKCQKLLGNPPLEKMN